MITLLSRLQELRTQLQNHAVGSLDWIAITKEIVAILDLLLNHPQPPAAA